MGLFSQFLFEVTRTSHAEPSDFRRTAGPSASHRVLRLLPVAHWRAWGAGDSRRCWRVPVRALPLLAATLATSPAPGSTGPSHLESSARLPPARPRAPSS